MRITHLAIATLLSIGVIGTTSAVAGPAFTYVDGKDKQKPPPKPAPKPPDKPKEPKKEDKKPEAKKPFAIGQEVDPTLSMTDVGGKAINFKDLRGKIVVVHFWSMANPGYDKRLAAMATEYASKNVTFVAIDPDSADAADTKKLQDYMTKSGITFPVVLDKNAALAERFAASNTAHAFVIDAKGMLRYSGAIDDDPKGEKADKATPHLKNAIDALVAGKDVTNSKTEPVGGSPIKREPPKETKPPAKPPSK